MRNLHMCVHASLHACGYVFQESTPKRCSLPYLVGRKGFSSGGGASRRHCGRGTGLQWAPHTELLGASSQGQHGQSSEGLSVPGFAVAEAVQMMGVTEGFQ